MIVSNNDRRIIQSLLDKTYNNPTNGLGVIEFDDLYSQLNHQEVDLIKRYLALNPKEYGFKGPKLGIEQVPELIKVEGQRVRRPSGQVEDLGTKYIPQPAYQAYQQLNQTMSQDIGRQLLLDSAYRSPAYQILVYLYYLAYHKYDLGVVSKRVALPGYSEHGSAGQPALDFITADGIPDDSDPLEFLKTPEYKWLLQHARSHGFKLTYPENNPHGVDFEPWHWRFVGRPA